MITLRISDAAALLNADWRGANNEFSNEFSGLASDSRRIERGVLFIALSGPHFDGHDYVEAARLAGARAALVARWVASELPQIKVPDTLRALGQLGVYWRQQFANPVVALTGSNGKTTVKEMIAAILRQRGRVLATPGNLNNAIGVPLTLARLGKHDYAVVEMGANHGGEIAYLTDLARPDVALITNAGPAHLEGFGDLAGVARAKGEIFQGLGPGGVAVINRDDAFADYWSELQAPGRRVLDFALQRPAQVSGASINGAPNQFRLRFSATGEQVAIRLPLPGRHNLYNALAAAAAALAVGVSLEHIRTGLETMTGVAGRLQPLPGPFGSTLLNDAYNANPASLAAGLQVLSELAAPRWLVLGDMAELGADVAELHQQAGLQARSFGLERVFTLGEHSYACALAFGRGGAHFTTVEELGEALLAALRVNAAPPPTILIKGSRSMRMERVVELLRAMAQPAAVVGGR